MSYLPMGAITPATGAGVSLDVWERWEAWAYNWAQTVRSASAMLPLETTLPQILDDLRTISWFRDATFGWVRFVYLGPSQQIVKHTDVVEGGPVTRYHIPILTNDGCWCYHESPHEHTNGWKRLYANQLYQMDPTQPHGAVNWGSEPRVHLLIDVKPRG